MKLLFLLTTIKDVPLGYRFRMYNYGPFDSEVLSDIDYAARLDALSVDMERYVNGYEYYIRPGPAADEVIDRDKPVRRHAPEGYRVDHWQFCIVVGGAP